MSKRAASPPALATPRAAQRLAEFKRYSIAHRLLKEVDSKLWRWIQEPGGASLIFVYGPTGVGKTTLRRRLATRLLESAAATSDSETPPTPVLALEAAAPENGNFHWGHFFRQLLRELEAPWRTKTAPDAPPTVPLERAGKQLGSLRAPAQDLRLLVEQSLHDRQPGVIIIDEAQHLTKISVGRRLQEQLDVLKSLAQQTGSLLVLIGTYELLTFQGLSGQLSRRSVNVHFPRYGAGAEDLKTFQSVLYSFQRRLPVLEEPDLLKHWEYCYVRSLGCVGILKDWLVRALSVSLTEGARTVSMRHLEETALSVWQCEQIARETLAGEERLVEQPGSMSRLTEMLGLVVQRMAVTALGEESAPAVSETKEKDVEKPPTKRRVGQRKPVRDPLA